MTTSPVTHRPRPGDLEAEPPTLDTLLYRELKRVAHFELLRRRPFETLDTTALVHEAYLKIAQRGPQARFKDRGHFLNAAAQTMRHILVDAARRRLSRKRGGGRRAEPLAEDLVAADDHAQEVLSVDQALAQLRGLDERLCRVVECRFFAGFSEVETAEALGVSARTVRRDWIRAKGWLRQLLGPPARPAETLEDDRG